MNHLAERLRDDVTAVLAPLMSHHSMSRNAKHKRAPYRMEVSSYLVTDEKLYLIMKR